MDIDTESAIYRSNTTLVPRWILIQIGYIEVIIILVP